MERMNGSKYMKISVDERRKQTCNFGWNIVLHPMGTGVGFMEALSFWLRIKVFFVLFCFLNSVKNSKHLPDATLCLTLSHNLSH